MPLNKDMLKEFEDCVNELKEPLLDMAKEYPTGVLMGAMLQSGTVVDPLDFTQITGVRIVPDPDSTIH